MKTLATRFEVRNGRIVLFDKDDNILEGASSRWGGSFYCYNNKGYNTAKNLYFNHWRKEFETARLKLIDVDDKFRDHYVTMYLKRRDYE